MKTTFKWLAMALPALFLAVADARAVTVTGTITDVNGTGYAARMQFIPLSNPQFEGSILINSAAKSITNNSNGTFSIVLEQGDYRVLVDGRDRFKISVPNGTATNSINTMVTSAMTYIYTTPPATSATLSGLGDVSVSNLQQDQYLKYDSATGKWKNITLAPGSGTVTSVKLALPTDKFSLTTNEVTSTGTLTAVENSQSANTVLAGPTSGGAAAPAYRALVTADIPNLDASKITSGTMAAAQLGGGTPDSTKFLGGDQTFRQVNDAQVASGAAIAKTKISSSGTWTAAEIPSLDAGKITTGTMATARLGSGTPDATTLLGGDQTYKQVANAQVAAGAAIDKSKISSTGTWTAAEIPSLDASKITTGTMATGRLGSGTPDATTLLGGDQTYKQIADAQVAAGAAIAKSKVSTNSTWSTNDIPSLDASKITSGSFSTSRLGSGTLDTTTFLGGDGTFRAVTDSQVSGGAAIAKSKISSSGTWTAAEIPSLDASKITSGTVATARLGSGAADSSVFLGGDQTYKQVSDSQVASGAAIAKSKISSSGTWVDADLPGTLTANARVAISKNSGATTGTRRKINFIEGSNVTITQNDNSGGEAVDVTINASGATGMSQIQEEGSNITQRNTLNFIGSALTATDNAGSSRTDVQLSQSPAGATTLVGTTRNVSTGRGLTGGGDLSTDRTIAFAYTDTLAGNPAMNGGEAEFGSTGILFEGSAADNFEGLLTVVNPTADRTWTLPDASGDVVLSSGGNLSIPGSIGMNSGGVTNDFSVGGNLTVGTNANITGIATAGTIRAPVGQFNSLTITNLGSGPYVAGRFSAGVGDLERRAFGGGIRDTGTIIDVDGSAIADYTNNNLNAFGNARFNARSTAELDYSTNANQTISLTGKKAHYVKMVADTVFSFSNIPTATNVFVEPIFLTVTNAGSFTGVFDFGGRGQIDSGIPPVFEANAEMTFTIWYNGYQVMVHVEGPRLRSNQFAIGNLTAISAVTNFVSDFSTEEDEIVATGDVNFQYSTNRVSSGALGQKKRIYIRASGGNRRVDLHSGWTKVGATTSPLTVTNNTGLLISFRNNGSSETNVQVGAIYTQ